MIAETDSHQGSVALEGASNIFDRLFGHLGITWPVGEQYGVSALGDEVVVPWHLQHIRSTLEQTASDARLGAAIDQNHPGCSIDAAAM